MLLVANGCSHTSGAEIEKHRNSECHEKAWPKHLADIWDCDHVNLSLCGGSNARVIRTTIEKIGELFNNNIHPKDIFVVILWPGPYRTELYEKKYQDHPTWKSWVPLVVGNDYTGDRSLNAQKYYKAWVTLYDSAWADTQNYIEVLSLQSYLKSWGINYFFYRASTTHLLSTNSFNSFEIQIDKKRFPGFKEKGNSYCEMLEYKGFKYAPYSKFGHYGQDGHIFFAKFLDWNVKKIYDL